MTPGPHVFGDGRIGIWVIQSSGLTDKLRHRLPQFKQFGVTDIFLPRQATLADKTLVRDAGYFAALYETPPHGLNADDYAAQALADLDRLKLEALELNIEGIADLTLARFITDTVAKIRAKRKALRLRINVVPRKGAYLPASLFQSDAQLYLLVQEFLGNMDARVAADELVRDVVERGIPRYKVSVMYGAHCAARTGDDRVPSLPEIRWRGSIYQDDLLADAGYIA